MDVVLKVLLYVIYYFDLNQAVEKKERFFLTCGLGTLSYICFNSCFEL